jgi:hypothetical protein
MLFVSFYRYLQLFLFHLDRLYRQFVVKISHTEQLWPEALLSCEGAIRVTEEEGWRRGAGKKGRREKNKERKAERKTGKVKGKWR